MPIWGGRSRRALVRQPPKVAPHGRWRRPGQDKESGAAAPDGDTENRNMKKSKQKTYLTPNEVAEMLMVNPVTVRQWAARGLLRSLTTPGGHRRFLLRDVEEFARSRGSPPAPRSSGRPDRVLIVDDDVQLGLSIAEMIGSRDANIAIEIAHDVFEAGLKVESFRPHALLL